MCVFVLCRAARGNGIRSGYPWHRHIRAADDVHHDPAYCVLHSLGVWRRHYANAVLATYQVRVQGTWSVKDKAHIFCFVKFIFKNKYNIDIFLNVTKGEGIFKRV